MMNDTKTQRVTSFRKRLDSWIEHKKRVKNSMISQMIARDAWYDAMKMNELQAVATQIQIGEELAMAVRKAKEDSFIQDTIVSYKEHVAVEAALVWMYEDRSVREAVLTAQNSAIDHINDEIWARS